MAEGDLPTQGTAELQATIITVTLQKALDELRLSTPILNMLPKDTKERFGESFTVGDTLRIPVKPIYVAADKAEYQPVNIQQGTYDKVDLVLNHHTYAAYEIEDLGRALSNNGRILEDQIGQCVIAIAERIETQCTGNFGAWSTGVGTATTAPTVGLLRAERKLLNAQRCPKLGRIAIVGNNYEEALLNDSVLAQQLAYSRPEIITDGDVGSLAGFAIKSSLFVDEAAAQDGSWSGLGWAGTPEAWVAAFRKLPTDAPGATQQVLTDPDTGLAVRATITYNGPATASLVVVDVLWGMAVARPQMGATLTYGVAAPQGN